MLGHRSCRRAALLFLACAFVSLPARAQSTDEPQPTSPIPNTEWLRVRFDVLGANYWDYSQARLGHETQGRIAWAIIGLSGKVNPYISYAAELNPVDDSPRPAPACGEPTYFYPNVPDPTLPPVACVPDGRNRVDLYRFIGLDPISQQHAVRTAFVDVHKPSGSFGVLAGRFVHPLGFGWRELGSWTNEDAPLIQRLNAEASFGALMYANVRRHGRRLLRMEAGWVRGDQNRSIEYSYSSFLPTDEDTNSGATGVGRITATPVKGLDVRVSGKYGFSGSKVESYPSFYHTKRNDQSAIGSIQYRAPRYVRVFGEYARYVSGLPETSVLLIGMVPKPVIKRGYYGGAELTVPLPRNWEGHVSVTGEDLSRNDSLVWYLEEHGLYRVHLGERVRSTIIRFSINPVRGVELGAYWNNLKNPYLWLSGIIPVTGPGAFIEHGEGRAKYGLVFRVQVP